jgi:hypothetical protein
MKYSEPRSYTEQEIDQIIKENKDQDICDMLLGVTFNEMSDQKAFAVCKKLFNCSNEQVIGTIFECLGHMARIHNTLPEDDVIRIYNKYKNSINDNIRWGIDIMLDDVSVFIPLLYDRLTRGNI